MSICGVGLGLPLDCYAFCYCSSLAAHPHPISKEERQREIPKQRQQKCPPVHWPHLQIYYSLCSGCEQWYGELAAPRGQEAHPGAPRWHFPPDLGTGTVYSKGDSRKLTTDGKNPNLLPTGLLNTANSWDSFKWAQHSWLHFPSVLLLPGQRTGSRKRSWGMSPRQSSTVVLESQKERRKFLIMSADVVGKSDSSAKIMGSWAWFKRWVLLLFTKKRVKVHPWMSRHWVLSDMSRYLLSYIFLASKVRFQSYCFTKNTEFWNTYGSIWKIKRKGGKKMKEKKSTLQEQVLKGLKFQLETTETAFNQRALNQQQRALR